MTDKRCFLQWFVLLLSFATATFFTGYYGLLQMIWQTDVTYMTSVIAGLFVVSVFYLGFSSWCYDRTRSWEDTAWAAKRTAAAVADTGIGRAAAYVITLVGLLGTVIGLTMQVRAMGSIGADVASLLGFLKTVSVALGSAFLATGCGIVGSIGIVIMTANLDYFIDRDEVPSND